MTTRLVSGSPDIFAVEKSSKIVTVTFKTATGATFTPNAITWTLSDPAGATYATGSVDPAATVQIFLKGAALALSDGFTGDAEERRLLIEATYNRAPSPTSRLKTKSGFLSATWPRSFERFEQWKNGPTTQSSGFQIGSKNSEPAGMNKKAGRIRLFWHLLKNCGPKMRRGPGKNDRLICDLRGDRHRLNDDWLMWGH